MISLFVFFALISSGSILCATVWDKKYEEILPITCSGIVMMLFLFGIAGILEAGVAFISILGIGIYVFSLAWSILKKKVKETLRNIFTPAFWVFIFGSVLLAIFIGGKVLWRWDEFSHWGDIVKVMTTLNDFGTNPESHSWFQSYPPGMSLFQYFLQKIHIWTANAEFSEWRLYFAFQIFCLSYFMPFFKKSRKQTFLQLLPFAFIIFLLPLLFFDDFYMSIYIDQFLGILAGTGLAMILWHKEKDLSYSLYIWSVCSMLILAKDAGMLLAAIVGIVYVIDCFFESKQAHQPAWKSVVNSTTTLLAIIAPKILWNYNIAANNATNAFNGKVDFSQLITIVLGRDSSYKQTVWDKFYKTLITSTVPLGNTGIKLNYLCLLLVFVLLIIVLVKLGNKKTGLAHERGILITIATVAQFVIYIIGMGITYVFKFTETEALNLASFTRYMNIVFLPAWIIIILSAIKLLQARDVNFSRVGVFCLLCIMIIVSPMESVHKYLSREAISTSVNGRTVYKELTNEIKTHVTPDDNVYFISQENSGFDLCVMRYNARPYYKEFEGWSIGKPFYKGDIWTREMTKEQWIDILCKNYDYVALFKINDYFMENFSSAFENEKDIAVNCVYKVNKDTRKLELCQ